MSLINCNSTWNQDIKRQFVQREVLACVTDWADQLFKPDYDDWDNIYSAVCPECGRMHTIEYAPAIDEYDAEDANPATHPYHCLHCNHRLEELPEEEQVDIYEFWIVSHWFGEKLKAHGEAVLDRYHGSVWGRRTTGQAIMLDEVISVICEELGLLVSSRDKEEVIS